MKMEKKFDAVAFMRQQRERVSQEYNENPEKFQEKMTRIRKRFDSSPKTEDFKVAK